MCLGVPGTFFLGSGGGVGEEEEKGGPPACTKHHTRTKKKPFSFSLPLRRPNDVTCSKNAELKSVRRGGRETEREREREKERERERERDVTGGLPIISRPEPETFSVYLYS